MLNWQHISSNTSLNPESRSRANATAFVIVVAFCPPAALHVVSRGVVHDAQGPVLALYGVLGMDHIQPDHLVEV